MNAAQPNAYLRTKVLTASPADLRLMLLDGALKFAEQGKVGLENQDHEAAFEGISRCQVGQFAADVRAVRPPEPYKGKGIRYLGEQIRRKVGKAATGSGA